MTSTPKEKITNKLQELIESAEFQTEVFSTAADICPGGGDILGKVSDAYLFMGIDLKALRVEIESVFNDIGNNDEKQLPKSEAKKT